VSGYLKASGGITKLQGTLSHFGTFEIYVKTTTGEGARGSPLAFQPHAGKTWNEDRLHNVIESGAGRHSEVNGMKREARRW